MIYTSSYKNCNFSKYETYSISGDCGKSANYTGKCYSALAPKLLFWKIWHDNIGKISEIKSINYEIEEMSRPEYIKNYLEDTIERNKILIKKNND